MCDAYYMNDGSDCPGKDLEIGGANGTVRETGFVDETNQENYPELGEHRIGVSLQYVQREPRFYASVAYNGSTWFLLNESNDANRNQQVFYYRGMGNGYNNNNAFWLRTGIGVKSLYTLMTLMKIEIWVEYVEKQNLLFAMLKYY